MVSIQVASIAKKVNRTVCSYKDSLNIDRLVNTFIYPALPLRSSFHGSSSPSTNKDFGKKNDTHIHAPTHALE